MKNRHEQMKTKAERWGYWSGVLFQAVFWSVLLLLAIAKLTEGNDGARLFRYENF